MFGLGSILGGIGEALSPWSNPSDAASPYLNQIPGTISPYYNPYINNGTSAGNTLNGQYGNLLNNPGGMVNQIGSNYHQSPGFQFALQQALQAGNHSAAAGGMAGSPQNQQQSMQTATGLADQDYNNYLQNAMGMYNQGLQGEQGMYGIGYNASNSLAQSLANNLQSQAGLAYQGANNSNQHSGGIFGDIFGGLGDFFGGGGFGKSGSGSGSNWSDGFGSGDSFY